MSISTTNRRGPAAVAAIDTTVRLVTPERITFEYTLAGPFSRATAYLIDLATLTGLSALGLFLALALSLGSGAGVGLFLVWLFVLTQFYGAFCEAVFNGRTLGKRLVGLRVVSAEGVPISGGQAVLRNLLWAFDGIWPFAYLPAIASMMLTRKFQRLGDLAAGTMVIVERRPRRQALLRIADAGSDAILAALPARLPVDDEWARTLADYVERRGRFDRARREEIAGPLAGPLRRDYHLPPASTADAILVAVYRRVLLGE